MRTLILLSAIPGSGKSTWAKQYAQEHPHTFIVSSDEIRFRLCGQGQDFSKEKEVWEEFLKSINGYAEQYDDCTVIADATNLKNDHRLYYHRVTPSFDKHILVMFQIPFEVCLLQNRMRRKNAIVPDEAMYQMKEMFESPSDEVMDIYDEVLFIGKSYRSKEAENI